MLADRAVSKWQPPVTKSHHVARWGLVTMCWNAVFTAGECAERLRKLAFVYVYEHTFTPVWLQPRGQSLLRRVIIQINTCWSVVSEVYLRGIISRNVHSNVVLMHELHRDAFSFLFFSFFSPLLGGSARTNSWQRVRRLLFSSWTCDRNRGYADLDDALESHYTAWGCEVLTGVC